MRSEHLQQKYTHQNLLIWKPLHLTCILTFKQKVYKSLLKITSHLKSNNFYGQAFVLIVKRWFFYPCYICFFLNFSRTLYLLKIRMKSFIFQNWFFLSRGCSLSAHIVWMEAFLELPFTVNIKYLTSTNSFLFKFLENSQYEQFILFQEIWINIYNFLY